MGLDNCTATFFSIGGDTQLPVSELSIRETECMEVDGPLEEAICKLCEVDPTYDSFIYYEIPVIVMKRWHKNWRIRKKWLKQYGTIQSTIKLLYQVDEIMPKCGKDDTVSISANVKCIGFSFEPWQLRRGMIVKIGDMNEDKES